MHRIRHSVASRGHVLDEKSSELGEKSFAPATAPSSFAASISANGFGAGNEYNVADFVKYHGSLFVRNAYLGLLKREPDATGQRVYTDALASGRLNKLDVLARLRYSAEGRRVGVRVNGLALPAVVRKIERIPIVGYLATWAIAVARLPVLHRYLRQSEFYLIEQQTNLASELGSFNAQISAELQHQRAHHDETLQMRREEIDQDIRVLTSSIAANHADLVKQLNEVRTVTKQSATAVQENAIALNGVRNNLQTQADAMKSHADEMTAQYQNLRSDLATQQKRYELLRRALSKRETAAVDEAWSGGTDDTDEQMTRPLDELYAAFEDQFRGDPEEIKERLRVYLPILRGAGVTSGVLDVGCGRGEWLQLLRAEKIEASGIDHNRVFIDRCREAGLNVERADTLEHLLKLPDNSQNFVSAFHLVEHLPFPDLVSMLDQIFRVLKPGGGLALETPNPENFMVGSHTFYTDPTHRHPIPSVTLTFVVESRGFRDVEVMRLREWEAAKLEESSELVKRFNEYFYCAPDYAVIAWKR